MSLIREEGQINDHTYLIDAVHLGKKAGYAVYLLKSEDGGTCLIDAGTKSSAPVIFERLKNLDTWPVDKIIFTHSHWDHTQGIGFLCRQAAKDNKIPAVFASEKARPYLADQSYNVCFGTDQSPFQNITDVIGLKNNDTIEVGPEMTLKIIDTPGHMVDHISVWDDKTGNVFVGDAIGMKWGDHLIVPNPNSHFWNEKDFLKSIELLKSIKPKTICLAHFGYLSGDDVQTFFDESVLMYEKWMEIFSKNSSRLDDIPHLIEIMWSKIYNHIPDGFRPLIQPGLTEALELAAGAYVKQHLDTVTLA